jgi:hypothetical protein
MQSCVPEDGRRHPLKHVEQTINKLLKNSCIMLVVIHNYTKDARKHECQMK